MKNVKRKEITLKMNSFLFLNLSMNDKILFKFNCRCLRLCKGENWQDEYEGKLAVDELF